MGLQTRLQKICRQIEIQTLAFKINFLLMPLLVDFAALISTEHNRICYLNGTRLKRRENRLTRHIVEGYQNIMVRGKIAKLYEYGLVAVKLQINILIGHIEV